MNTITWVCLVLGALLLLTFAWEVAGRSRAARSWLTKRSANAVSNALFLRPALGYLLLVLGVTPLLEGAPLVLGLLGVLAIPALVVMFWWGIFRFPYPVALVPRWARPEIEERRRRERE